MKGVPPEIVENILQYIQLPILKNIYDNSPNDHLKFLIATRLYKKIHYGLYHSFGPFYYSCEDYCISIEELYILADGNISASVQSLTIADDEPYYNEFLSFSKANPTFISTIAKVKYLGTGRKFMEYAAQFPVANFVELDLKNAEQMRVANLPSNVHKLSLTFSSPINSVLMGWPASLKTLKIDWQNSTASLKLPSGLEEFECRGWDNEGIIEFPQGLKRLKLKGANISVDEWQLPTLLEELELSNCGIRDIETPAFLLPSTLKKLSLTNNPITSLANVLFPKDLQFLNVLYCELTTLEGVSFPLLLQELRVDHNSIPTFENVDLGSLKLLDNSGYSSQNPNYMKHLSKTTFPDTLETLILGDLPIKDWPQAVLHNTLKQLTLYCTDDPKTLTFPPALEILELQFPYKSDYKYSDLNLPLSLQKLELIFGNSSEFDWNLPNLKCMTLINFEGAITIPKTVMMLSIITNNKKVFDALEIPFGAEKVTLSFQAKLPNSVIDLEILNFDSGTQYVLPQKLASARLFSGQFEGPVKRGLLLLPETLQYIDGYVDPTLAEEVNLKRCMK